MGKLLMMILHEFINVGFVHNCSDTLRTSSFQFQLRGRKLWHICGPDQDDNIRRFDDMEQNMFAPDYEKRPWVRNASCFFDIVSRMQQTRAAVFVLNKVV